MSQDQDLVDEYKLINLIAGGNSSQVWEVGEKDSSNRYAMKLLLPEAHADKERVRTLKQEAKIGDSFDHPNLVKFHKVVATKKHAYLIMEYFRAANVKAQINADILQVQIRIRKLVEGMCAALGYMHEKGWVHRDIKPDNVLLSKGSEVRIVDFSLSTRAASALSKMVGKVKVIQGTRTYLAPETIRRERPTIQTDMYSFGVTLYEFLTGVPPFRGGTPDELLRKHLSAPPHAPSWVNRNVTKETDELVLRMLAKKASERPATMDEVAVAFRSLKIFEEDVAEIAERKKQEEEARKQEELDKPDNILDSRADAMRTAMGVKAPPRRPKKGPVEPPPEPAAKPKPPAAAQPAPPQQPQPQSQQPPPGAYPGQYPPGGGYPQFAPGMYPGMPYGAPGFAPGQPPPPGQPPLAQPGQPPYYPPQQKPGMPQQSPTQPPPPSSAAPQGQPNPAPQPQQPAPQQPAAGQPQQAPPPQQQPPQQPPPPPKQPPPPPVEPDDMPLMDELPDIS